MARDRVGGDFTIVNADRHHRKRRQTEFHGIGKDYFSGRDDGVDGSVELDDRVGFGVDAAIGCAAVHIRGQGDVRGVDGDGIGPVEVGKTKPHQLSTDGCAQKHAIRVVHERALGTYSLIVHNVLAAVARWSTAWNWLAAGCAHEAKQGRNKQEGWESIWHPFGHELFFCELTYLGVIFIHLRYVRVKMRRSLPGSSAFRRTKRSRHRVASFSSDCASHADVRVALPVRGTVLLSTNVYSETDLRLESRFPLPVTLVARVLARAGGPVLARHLVRNNLDCADLGILDVGVIVILILPSVTSTGMFY